MNWYLKCLKQYADFRSRARRKEYWMFYLFNVIISIVLMIIDMAVGSFNEVSGLGLLSGLYSLAVLIPGLAVTVRRLHDINKSGWNFLIVLIPLVGPIVLLVWLCTDGDIYENKWGVNPKMSEDPNQG